MKKISFDTALKILILIVLGAILIMLLQNKFTRYDTEDKQKQDPLSLPFIQDFIAKNPRGMITQYTNNGETLYRLNSFAIGDGFSLQDDAGKTAVSCSTIPQAFNRPLCTRIKTWDSQVIYGGQKIDNKKDVQKTPLSFCPDEKIINEMPTGDGTTNKAYYIYKGQRYETEQFDQKWLQEHCSIKEQIVY